MDDRPLNSPANRQSGAGAKSPILFGILFGAVLGLVIALAYLLYQVNQVVDDLDRVHNELTQARQQLLAEIAKVRETSTVTTQNNQSTVESLRIELEEARTQARVAAGAAKLEAIRRVDAAQAKLEKKMNEDHAKTETAVSEAVSQVKQVKTATEDAAARVGEIKTDVGNVRTELSATRSELEKTVADLKTTMGDLGLQSEKIATNGKELAALKALGDRDITDLKLPKEKTPRKISDIQVRLKAADPKRNRYTVEIIADDKRFEKKDKSVNEPVQFILWGIAQPYELVVNEVKKDMIVGYLSAPKSQPRRP